jgi:hypothetical protein
VFDAVGMAENMIPLVDYENDLTLRDALQMHQRQTLRGVAVKPDVRVLSGDLVDDFFSEVRQSLIQISFRRPVKIGHVEMNDVMSVQARLKKGIVGDGRILEKGPGIAASAVTSLQHVVGPCFAEPSGA